MVWYVHGAVISSSTHGSRKTWLANSNNNEQREKIIRHHQLMKDLIIAPIYYIECHTNIECDIFHAYVAGVLLWNWYIEYPIMDMLYWTIEPDKTEQTQEPRWKRSSQSYSIQYIVCNHSRCLDLGIRMQYGWGIHFNERVWFCVCLCMHVGKHSYFTVNFFSIIRLFFIFYDLVELCMSLFLVHNLYYPVQNDSMYL